MSSKASRLRAKRARNAGDGMDLAPTPRRKKRGRARMIELHGVPSVDHRKTTLEARCRRAGLDVTEEAMREVSAPWAGCEAGQAMAQEVSAEDKRARLWDAIQHVRRVYAAYDRAMGAPSRHAQSLRIMLPSDEMHADAASPPLDMRDDEQRQDDAERHWARVQGLIGRYGRYTATITERCVVDNQRCENATAMVLALQNVADAMQGAKCS